MKSTAAICALIAGTLLSCVAHAQQKLTVRPAAPPPAVTSKTGVAQVPAPSPAAQSDSSAAAAPAAPPPGWVTRCNSGGRQDTLECVIEQSAVLTRTGQLVVLVSIRLPSDTRSPVALIQIPLGVFLPNGVKLQVDDGKTTDIPLQTCEQRGCFAGAGIPAELLNSLRSGKQLKVSFQNLAKEVIAIPLPLGEFASAYDKIK
jgi:invasion protein IalB